MSRMEAPATIGPDSYASWRATVLGGVTEALEQRLILDMMGELRGARVLDAGCGDGTLVCVAAFRGATVIGVDPHRAMLAAARSRVERARVSATFLEGRVERLPFADTSFDVVAAAITVLCFVPDAAGALSEMARVLRLGGRLVLGELGPLSAWAMIRLRVWLGSTTWRTARFRSAAELRGLAEQAGLTVTAIGAAVLYPPIGALARIFGPIDPWLGRLTTFGGAFVTLRAVSVGDGRRG